MPDTFNFPHAKDRYSARANGPDIILIVDNATGLIIARNSKGSIEAVTDLVRLANAGWRAELEPPTEPTS